MNKSVRAVSVGLGVFVAGLCSQSAASLNIIPMPDTVIEKEGTFTLSKATEIYYQGDDRVHGVANYLSKTISKDALVVKEGVGTGNSVALQLKDGDKEHGYTCDVSGENVIISSPTAQGLFYGVQTFLQLLPANVYSDEGLTEDATVGAVTIVDAPYFTWRGYQLDISRHFFGKEHIKETLNLMAMHRMNIFHLHLSDDVAYRLESKKFPKLHQVGARSASGEALSQKNRSKAVVVDDTWPKAEYLSIVDVKDIVAYAKERFITVIPEVDLPGHAGGILRAYPEHRLPVVNADGTAGGLDAITINPSSSETMQFVKELLAEVNEMFGAPGIIHVGADEVNLKRQVMSPEDQTKFLKDIEVYLADELNTEAIIWNSHRKAHANGGIDTGYVQFWHGRKAVSDYLKPEKVNMKWINSWARCFYLDARQTDPDKGQRWCMPRNKAGEKVPLSSEFIYNIQSPYEPYHTEHKVSLEMLKERMVGIEAPLWCELVPDEKMATEKTWPRLTVASEHMWRKPRADKAWSESWSAYAPRLLNHMKRFDAQGVTDYFKVSFRSKTKISNKDQ